MPRRRVKPRSATQPTWPGTAIPQPPNIGYVIERVNARAPHLLRTNTPAADVEFLTLVCAEPEAKQYAYGLLSKPNPGSPDPRGYTFPPEYRANTKCAMDVIALPDGNRVDVINGSDNAPTPGTWCWNPVAPFDAAGNSQWRDSDTYLDITDWPPFDSGTAAADELPPARLGFGWFCAIRAVKDWYPRALDNRTYIERELDPDYYRVIGDLNGTPHLQPGEVDFWSMAGCDITAPAWLEDATRALDFLRRKVWFTLSGSVTHWQTADQRRRNNDRIVQLFTGRWDQVELLEIANEYQVNGWTDPMIQECARDLRSKVPPEILITLSSPDLAHGVGIEHATNEDMADAIEALYGTGGSDHYGANTITVHLVRDFSIKWSVPGAYNGITASSGWRVDLPYNNGEPLGPGASTGGDVTDPAVVIGTYVDTSEAAWHRYTGHSGGRSSMAPCPRSGRGRRMLRTCGNTRTCRRS